MNRFTYTSILLILLIFTLLFFDTKNNQENFIDNNVLIYSNYLKDGDYKEIKFDLNVRPILPDKLTTIDDWRYNNYIKNNLPVPVT